MGALFYRAVRTAFRAAAGPLFSLRVDDAHLVPTRGAGIVVAPHRSWLDPPCLGAACPRPVQFLILEGVYHKRWARWFYRRMLSIPVAPGGARSLAALRGALRALEHGAMIGVFPEGRVVRAGERGRIHPGAALLAVRSGCPVVPAAIDGTDRAWPPGRVLPRAAPVRVRFMAPLEPEPRDAPGAVETMRARIESVLAGPAPGEARS